MTLKIGILPGNSEPQRPKVGDNKALPVIFDLPEDSGIWDWERGEDFWGTGNGHRQTPVQIQFGGIDGDLDVLTPRDRKRVSEWQGRMTREHIAHPNSNAERSRIDRSESGGSSPAVAGEDPSEPSRLRAFVG